MIVRICDFSLENRKYPPPFRGGLRAPGGEQGETPRSHPPSGSEIENRLCFIFSWLARYIFSGFSGGGGGSAKTPQRKKLFQVLYMYMYICIMHYVLCIMYYVLCIMYYVLCIMYYVLCIMYYVLCIMYYVLCIMYVCMYVCMYIYIYIAD